MNIYKVIFAKNTVIDCHPVDNHFKLEGQYYYEHDKGQPIYAIIKAPSEPDAVQMANGIIREVNEKVFGRDYI
ncbi:MAG: hypothetical protein V4649_17140 [Bacteroidota bacterium]